MVMVFPGYVTRAWQRLAVAVVVFLAATAAGYGIESTPPMYLESATVMYSLPRSQTAPNAYFWFAPSIITSGEAMTQILLSPQSQRQIREEGGKASINLALINLYNEEYPNYGVPLATLTAASPNAVNAHRTFTIAARMLGRLLAARQARVGVPPRDRISAQIIGDSRPIPQVGSHKRAFAGLAVLALLAISLAWGLLGRRGGADALPEGQSIPASRRGE
jgi:hypothetical protein